MNKITLEEKQYRLNELIRMVQSINQKGVASDPAVYFDRLRNHCTALARIVHLGQVDLANNPYIYHPANVACGAATALTYCGAVLHDVVENGGDLGVTIDFLRDKMNLPPVLVEIVDALSRRSGESYRQYLVRVLGNYIAAKIKLVDMVENADITRYDCPTKEKHIRCCKYLDKAMTLKSNPAFQAEIPFDYVNDIVAMSKIREMTYAHETLTVDADGTVGILLYFKYNWQGDYKHLLTFVTRVNSDSDSVIVETTTEPLFYNKTDRSISTQRQTTLKFKSIHAAEEYLKQVMDRINCETITKKIMLPNSDMFKKQLKLASVTNPN